MQTSPKAARNDATKTGTRQTPFSDSRRHSNRRHSPLPLLASPSFTLRQQEQQQPQQQSLPTQKKASQSLPIKSNQPALGFLHRNSSSLES
jgi:hypothetical protein